MKDEVKLPRGWTKAAKENPQEFFGYLITCLTGTARGVYPRATNMPDKKRVEWFMKVNEHVHQMSGAMNAEPLRLSFLKGQLREVLESRALSVDEVRRAIRFCKVRSSTTKRRAAK